MNTYKITMPVCGYVYKEIKANSEEEAVDIMLNNGFDNEEIQEAEMFPRINTGNVCNVNTSEMEIDEK